MSSEGLYTRAKGLYTNDKGLYTHDKGLYMSTEHATGAGIEVPIAGKRPRIDTRLVCVSVLHTRKFALELEFCCIQMPWALTSPPSPDSAQGSNPAMPL